MLPLQLLPCCCDGMCQKHSCLLYTDTLVHNSVWRTANSDGQQLQSALHSIYSHRLCIAPVHVSWPLRACQIPHYRWYVISLGSTMSIYSSMGGQTGVRKHCNIHPALHCDLNCKILHSLVFRSEWSETTSPVDMPAPIMAMMFLPAGKRTTAQMTWLSL